MAESAAFSLASKILVTIYKEARKKGASISEARDELDKLRVTIETIQAVLLDAEKKQEGSAAVKNWIKRVKSVLYDAEDLFDEVATEDLLKQQMMEEGSNKLSFKNKVRVSFSKLNPIVSRNSIAKKVKAIRKSLADISADIAQLGFVRCHREEPRFFVGKGRDPGCFVDARDVIGRYRDKNVILRMLVNDLDSAKSDNPAVFAIVGIGGMGKTTLAQLIYNDEEVKKNFQEKWFACISDTSDEREVLGKIFQSISGGSYSYLDVGQLQTKIRESIKDKKYLLVLDDVWEDDRGRWRDRMSLLSSHEPGSMIIVTTRLPSVAKAVGALGAHNLKGLSEDDSWSLFKRFAFDHEEYENDPRKESLGREILKKCSGVPLAIRSIGSLLFLKNTIREWEAIEKEDLPTLGRNYNDETMSVLKLSYDHLPSYLKHCFAYCCLFPKDHRFSKLDLINHWISQGYIELHDEESGLMHLLRRGFFQEVEEDEFGEIQSFKMHDLMHDLAKYVAGEESVVLSSTSSNTSSCARHVSFWFSEIHESWNISTVVLNTKSLRSLLFRNCWCTMEIPKLDQLFASVKMLRTLSLSWLRIENIPPSIGELKLLKYLNLSSSSFKELPNSITNLVNLLSLNLQRCENFQVWPLDFHKLINLRYLNVEFCNELRSMPVGIAGMTNLLYLNVYKLEKGGGLNMSIGLPQQVRSRLTIRFMCDVRGENGVDGDIYSWKLPVSFQDFHMLNYKGVRIPGWVNSGSTNNLARLRLRGCRNVKYLPPLRCLPNLRWLEVIELSELEFMEEGDYTDYSFSASKFFPCLEELVLEGLPKLNRWWGKLAAEVTTSSTFVKFPLLCELKVKECSETRILSTRFTNFLLLLHFSIS